MKQQSAFQVGCREFEPRLPLFSMDSCSQCASLAASEEYENDGFLFLQKAFNKLCLSIVHT